MKIIMEKKKQIGLSIIKKIGPNSVTKSKKLKPRIKYIRSNLINL